MLAIISQMAALFILILVGYGAAKLKIIDGRFSQQLSVFVINISSPCLIVSSVMGDISPDKGLILPVLAIGCVTYAFFVAVAMLLSRIITKNKDMQGIYGSRLDFRQIRHLLCEPAEHPVHPSGILAREKDDTGRSGRAETGLENTCKPGHDSLLPVHPDSGVRH